MLNLQELEQKLDAALAPESLREWLLNQRISKPEDQPTPEESQLEETSASH